MLLAPLLQPGLRLHGAGTQRAVPLEHEMIVPAFGRMNRGTGQYDQIDELHCQHLPGRTGLSTHTPGYFFNERIQSTMVLISESGKPGCGGIGTCPHVPTWPCFTAAIRVCSAFGWPANFAATSS